MLKIKDDVDLKRLETFGFTECEFDFDLTDKNGDSIIIYKHNKLLNCYIAFDDLFDVLFDLIRVNLVEKVEK